MIGMSYIKKLIIFFTGLGLLLPAACHGESLSQTKLCWNGTIITNEDESSTEGLFIKDLQTGELRFIETDAYLIEDCDAAYIYLVESIPGKEAVWLYRSDGEKLTKYPKCIELPDVVEVMAFVDGFLYYAVSRPASDDSSLGEYLFQRVDKEGNIYACTPLEDRCILSDSPAFSQEGVIAADRCLYFPDGTSDRYFTEEAMENYDYESDIRACTWLDEERLLFWANKKDLLLWNNHILLQYSLKDKSVTEWKTLSNESIELEPFMDLIDADMAVDSSGTKLATMIGRTRNNSIHFRDGGYYPSGGSKKMDVYVIDLQSGAMTLVWGNSDQLETDPERRFFRMHCKICWI